MRMAFFYRLWFIVASGMLAAACANVPDSTTPAVEASSLVYAQGEIEEGKLLNVWIERFRYAPVKSEEAKETGASKEIREAETRFMPVHLKDTLQATGLWGAVRVVPENSLTGGELTVSGTIDRSNGRTLAVDITARDALGAVWLDRAYSLDVVPANYEQLLPHEWDAFQGFYNQVANDLADALRRRKADDISRIRDAAVLRFARYIAPHGFDDYVSESRNGRLSIERLPAENDPLYRQVLALKARNDMLVDILNTHYDQFYDAMWEPYTSWRRTSLNETLALERIEQEATAKKVGGALAILGAIGLAASGGKTADRTGVLQGVMAAGGVLAIKAGIDQSSEKKMHEAAVEELGNSFKNEIEPMVIEVDGEMVELTGSAEAQFAR
ncbi:MAG: hypothetical protein D6782_05040, partial [Alphaproteobacteria bacterium]